MRLNFLVVDLENLIAIGSFFLLFAFIMWAKGLFPFLILDKILLVIGPFF